MIRTLINLLVERENEGASTLLVIGAGKASYLPVLRHLRADRTILVEASPHLAQFARARVKPHLGEAVRCEAVTPHGGSSVLYSLSQWKYSSLKEPLGLLEHCPNISLLAEIEIESTPLVQLIKSVDIQPSGVNILLLDVPGQATQLIESISESFCLDFKWIMVRCSDFPLFADEVIAEDVITLLRSIGYERVGESPESIFPERFILFVRDSSLAEKRVVRQEVEALARKGEETTKLIRALRKTFDDANQMVSQKLALIADEIKGLNRRDAAALDELSRLQEAVGHGLSRATKDVYRRVDRSTLVAAKQVEAFVGVQEYFSSGKLPVLSTEAHSWPVSPDFALYLIELVEKGNYDLVIEFGSGVSTAILAKTLMRKRLSYNRSDSSSVTSFEHLEEYFEKTASHLDHLDLSAEVNLVLAPLTTYQGPNGCSYSYYDCAEVIERLSKQQGLRRRVLVVIDGPPGKTCKHARYPALPLVTSAFALDHIDFVLDDYERSEEAEVVEMWKEYLTEAGIPYEAEVRRLQKDACLIRVRASG